MQKGNTMVIVIIVIALLAAGWFFMQKKGSDDTMMGEEAMMQEGEEMMEGEDAMMGDVLDVTVEGGSFYYKPNIIEAKVGQTVRVTFNSVDMQHDFDIDELNVNTDPIPGGQSMTFEFTPDKAGEFEFYCSVGQHRANGMVGTLKVTE